MNGPIPIVIVKPRESYINFSEKLENKIIELGINLKQATKATRASLFRDAVYVFSLQSNEHIKKNNQGCLCFSLPYSPEHNYLFSDTSKNRWAKDMGAEVYLSPEELKSPGIVREKSKIIRGGPDKLFGGLLEYRDNGISILSGDDALNYLYDSGDQPQMSVDAIKFLKNQGAKINWGISDAVCEFESDEITYSNTPLDKILGILEEKKNNIEHHRQTTNNL